MMLLLRGTQACESILTVCFVIFLSAVDVLQYILASAYDPNAQSESGEASPLALQQSQLETKTLFRYFH